MSDLKSRLREDLTSAMRERDELRVATLRMTLTAISNEEVAGKEARELDDAEVTAVLVREAKKRREAAEAYDGADRPELAERERAEGAVLSAYLPATLTEEELSRLVDEAVAEAEAGGASGMKAMGLVMKTLQPKVTGRADGAAVAAMVRARLS